MRHLFSILVALSLADAVLAGVRVQTRAIASAPVAASESAALFVGVREFPDDETLTTVQYAVDDAVDLAFLLAVDRDPVLVDPRRVILALSGEPQKEQSKANLKTLCDAGAVVRTARKSEVVKLLEKQAAMVGENGLLIVSFATHGTNDGGTQHLLASDSLLRHEDTGLTETKIRDIVTVARVPRALILIDACRERLTRDIRAGSASPQSAAARLLEDLGRINGQVVFSAAAPGQYAYDDEVHRNGVFTAAVIDGLRCEAPRDEQGFVTVATLKTYVEDRVLAWVQKHRDPDARRATQISAEGRSESMPLAVCR